MDKRRQHEFAPHILPRPRASIVSRLLPKVGRHRVKFAVSGQRVCLRVSPGSTPARMISNIRQMLKNAAPARAGPREQALETCSPDSLPPDRPQENKWEHPRAMVEHHSRHCRGDIRPPASRFIHLLPEFGQIGTNLDLCLPNLAKLGPRCAKFDQLSATFGRIRAVAQLVGQSFVDRSCGAVGLPVSKYPMRDHPPVEGRQGLSARIPHRILCICDLFRPRPTKKPRFTTHLS